MKTQILISIVTLLISHSIHAQKLKGEEEDLKSILQNISKFSEYVMSADVEQIGKSYTADAKIFPNNTKIIEGRAAIMDYWTPSENSRINYHKIKPEEIKINDNEAYDYGYYEGISISPNGNESNWKGKYVIIWKKINGEWKIYLDIWNSVRD